MYPFLIYIERQYGFFRPWIKNVIYRYLDCGDLHCGLARVNCGPTIWPHDKDALENLARYIVRASFSQERMAYIPADQSPDGEAWVIYQPKDGTTTKTFNALDCLAQLTTHISYKMDDIVHLSITNPTTLSNSEFDNSGKSEKIIAMHLI